MTIDKTFLINLPSRPDRRAEAIKELFMLDIPYEPINGIEHERGAYGLWLTMYDLLERAEEEKLGNILILEDDVVFLTDPKAHLWEALRELEGKEWDLLYLGANVDAPLHKLEGCSHILMCNSMFATHAVVYSPSGRRVLLAEMDRIVARGITTPEPIDMTMVRVVQSRGKSFICNPLLATQRTGYSDIAKKEIDYKKHIEDKFKKRLKELKWSQ